MNNTIFMSKERMRKMSGRSLRFAAAFLFALLMATILLGPQELGNYFLTTIAMPAFIAAVLSSFGFLSGDSDRSYATGFVVGFPCSFFALQRNYALTIENNELLNGADIILGGAGLLALILWGVDLWFSHRSFKASKDIVT